MGQRISVVVKLVDIKGARRFIGKAAGIILVVGRVAFIDVGAGEQHRRAQRPQMKDFLAAHFVRHHQDQAVIFCAAISARPRPVLPAVASIIVPRAPVFPGARLH